MSAGGRRRTWIAATIAAAALGMGDASAGAKNTVNSFEGSCSLQGTVRFSPPATNAQQSLSVVYDATGACSGTLNGRTISNAPVTVHDSVRQVDGSCMRADTTKPGRGSITFADGTTIRFSFEFHFVAAAGTLSYNGQQSGTAHGTGSFATPRTPPDIAQQCAGAGVSETPLDISLVTDSPLVSKSAGS
ncbi:MAG: hypothetical protein E6G10_06180 [Actinobacteria bacterium]|nr:MAG: hypothetical protein E6G10_06180 [Actinomycetota bacterium]